MTEPKAPTAGSWVVTPEQGGHMLDAVLRANLGASWGDCRRWITEGKVSVDGQVLRSATRNVRAGSAIAFDPRARRRDRPYLEPSALVHLDAHVVVVDKPAGLSTIPYEGIGATAADARAETLDALVRDHLTRLARTARAAGGKAGRAPVRANAERPNLGIVHRLDKETSGLIVFTRTWLAKQALTAEFRAHTVERRYLALVHGRLTARTLTSHLVENRGDGLRGSIEAMTPGMRKKAKGSLAGAQRAVTHVEPVEHLEGATLVSCRLETGRTHQIRIHLSEAGHPLIGERVYIRGFVGEPIPAPRMMLHAAELGFVHPATEEPVHWERSPPDDFAETLARLSAAPPSAG
jgi:23S rRNA pseudouridine1911/1915/1917 synthase